MITQLEMCIRLYLWILICLHQLFTTYLCSFEREMRDQDRKNLYSEWDEPVLIRMVNNDPGVTTAAMKSNLTSIGFNASRPTITTTLNRGSLKKTPLSKKNHLIAGLMRVGDFRKKPESFWHSVLWSDETKLDLFGHNDKTTIWSKRGIYNLKYTILTVKHCEVNIMPWSFFIW